MYPTDAPTNELQQSKCPVCGSQDFEWGRLQAYYVPGTSLWSAKGRQMVKARRCLRCNNLLQFTDTARTAQFNRIVIVIVAISLLISLSVVVLSF